VTLHVDVRLDARGLDVALDVGEGETVALLGPNGAGKSTVLDLVCGLLVPDAGTVALDGRVLTGDDAWVPPHRRRVALLAQDPLLLPHLSARGNVAFAPRAQGVGRREASARAQALLDRLGVGDLADRRPSALSGGQAQRVAVARALAAEPRLLLLDEPLAALDVAVAPQVRGLLREVLQGRSAVVVTHDPLDALALADRVVVLEGGRVVEDGPTRDVLARPRSEFAARVAGLDLLAGTVRGGAVHAADRVVEGVAASPLAEGRPAVAVFRPASVAVHRERPGGSPRNAWPAVVTELEPRGDLVRVRAGDVAADVTLAAVADLRLVPGDRVWLVVKASEVSLHPARG
jgi:molybdate transport system ATP-binding protein